MSKLLPVYREAIDLAMCKACGGECCKSGPGAATPEDFGAPDERALGHRLVEALRSRQWVTDSMWRPFIGPNGKLIDVSGDVEKLTWIEPARKRTGSCVFWSSRGCRIFNTRPTGCRTLEPRRGLAGISCEQDPRMATAFFKAWARWQTVLLAAMAQVPT